MGSSFPLPHWVAAEHTLGLALLHVKNGSTLHAEEQPSPPMASPSSQASPVTRMPSPHCGLQPMALQCQPVSTDLQSAAQPSVAATLPSSHASLGVRTPS